MLEILAQTRNPQAVQPHLRKCFDAIQSLEFAGVSVEALENVSVTNEILSMVSPEGEKVAFGKGLKARGHVEDWLGKVEEAMVITIRKLFSQAISQYMMPNKETWITTNISQVVLTVSQCMMCKDMTDLMERKGDKVGPLKEMELRAVTGLNKLASLVRGKLEPLDRATVCTLITVDVHARDIISEMVRNRVFKADMFEWKKQLRYYWDKDEENMIVRMSNSSYSYGCEYIGNSPRLVITPLTDRCYLCLMGALQLDLGGAPAGPAGTGKTETTKDLAKGLAKQCVVFNCSDGLDYLMMGRFFAGLAQSGAWCCFDEFNRIDIEVLSVIAQQLLTIRNAKLAKVARFMFEGREIKLIPSCAAFVTMNPGYAGRTELPDNLKALFRPFSMMVPDYCLIAEVILYSEGFESSKNLAQKMTQMYKLCSEQLSQQDHYDFGMRALKSVLVTAGSLKRQNPDKNEDVVLIRALRDSNLPKFTKDDAVLFEAILQDLFPGVEIPEHNYGFLETEIQNVMTQRGLQCVASQEKKVIQLYETMLVRHGVMLLLADVCMSLKDSNSGSTSTSAPVDYFFRNVKMFVLNPKSINMGELYGQVDRLTLEWMDGLMGITIRQAVQDTSDSHQWVICDGPVDALWIENMNTVLDDNKMLCLANSERIKFTPHIHMIFEVQDLAVASPATNCKHPFPAEAYDYLHSLFERHVGDGLKFIKKYCHEIIPQVDISKITTMCKLFETLMLKNKDVDYRIDLSKLLNLVSGTFVWCYLWAVGGNISENDWDSFDSFIRSQFDEDTNSKLPVSGDLWSQRIDFVLRRMELWDKVVPLFKYSKEVPFFEILVPTVDTVRFSYLLDKLVSANQCVLFTGQTGVGKSVVARGGLLSMSQHKKYSSIFFNFSAQTTSARLQEMLESKMEKKRKNILGAPNDRRMILMVDDLNMPKYDTYGSQPPIELLRQMIDCGGFYDRQKLFWKELQDLTICAACGPPGGGRNNVTPRLLRHFSILALPCPSEHCLKTLFTLVQFMLELNVRSTFYKTAWNNVLNRLIFFHYKAILGGFFMEYPLKIRMMQADFNVMREAKQFYRLFYHEALRVFHDRLVDDTDKRTFYHLLSDVTSRLFTEETMTEQDFETQSIIFGDFIKIGLPKEERVYDDLTNNDKIKSVLKDVSFFSVCVCEYVCECVCKRPKRLAFRKIIEMPFFSFSSIESVLCMSPVGSSFRTRCRMFPSLVNCCTIDWFVQWPKEALLSVSNQAFEGVELIDEDLKSNIARMCVEIHTSASESAEKFYEELRRRYYTTPTSYLELINLYVAMLADKKKQLVGARERVKNGLSKLLETNELVDKMKVDLIALEPELKKMSENTEKLMEKLALEQVDADEVKRIVKEEESLAEMKARETQAIADDAQKDLNKALPALDNAIKALDALDKADISEIRVYTVPPELVQTVMEAVCLLLNVKPDWSWAKVLLGDANFLKRLYEYDKDRIPDSLIKKLKKYIDNPKFTPEAVEKVSRVGCLAEAQQELDIVLRNLKEKQEKLLKVEEDITRLQKMYDDSVAKKLALTKNIALTQARLRRAGKLTTALASEKTRWDESVENMTLVSVLADPFEVRQWNTHGLPRDKANRWIRNKESTNSLKTIKSNEVNFLRTLETAIRLGLPVLMEDVGEHIDPALDPILLRQTAVIGGRLVMHLGDTDVEYDKNFRLYITTKLPNPHYMPEVCIKVTIINFTVTFSGLEDQLLGDVVGLERLDLEDQRNQLIVKINTDRNQLKSIEDKILKLLERLTDAEATEEKISLSREKYRVVATRGSIMYFVVANMAEVDNMYQFSLKYFKNLFCNTLLTSAKSKDLDVRLSILLRGTLLDVYRNVSRGLFEKDKLIFSFMLCIEIMRNAGEISNEEWTYFLRGAGPLNYKLPNKPRLVPKLGDATWKGLCDMSTVLPVFEQLLEHLRNPPISLRLGAYTTKLASKLLAADDEMTPVQSGSEVSMEAQFPDGFTSFQKLLILKLFRPEELVLVCMEFVKQNLGQAFVESPMTDLPALYNDLSNITPLIFILSPGSDPMSAFLRFVKEREFQDRMQAISLGQGQGPVAKRLLTSSMKYGDWVFLQNCHLAASWMPELEETVKNMINKPSDVNDNFRLFLSSMPTTSFPVAILQNSVKVTNEPPKGIKSNLRKALVDMGEDFFDEHALGSTWKKMVFGICFFHSVLLERGKFGPLGWNIKYDFNESDRECALLNMQMFCLNSIPWDALIYLTAEIIYGGRVTDQWDQRCLRTILKKFFNADVIADGYKYSESGIYYAPSQGGLSEFLAHVESLPSIDPPEIFGMHDNANIVFQEQETSSLMATVLSLQPRSGSTASAQLTDQTVLTMAQEYLDILPPRMNASDAKHELMQLDDKGRTNSLTTVLLQEVERYNKLLDVIGSLSSWFKDLVHRCRFISDWLARGEPLLYWISGFYFPQGFT
ncbi:hypothetical protein HELRODRAFT_194633 [Helobdella robusta]|uniref:AAA+ ATPase domain-containing protein n=1 Tax=Helobdella robusta TaxID=6412 RepID=T1FW91_HELRO|nr:hypothetical protein HELRODRAFT_194633 [Helobdella robusta]ESN90843.1 hypothetical protein HELRODRAFT_194633 [Helobdella robusta]